MSRMVPHHRVSVFAVEDTGRGRRPWRVRRRVGDRTVSTAFVTKRAADVFRAQLLTAISHGEPWHAGEGLPVSMARAGTRTIWEAAREHYRSRRPQLRPRSRKSLAEALAWVAACATDPQPSDRSRVYGHCYAVLAGADGDPGVAAWLDQASVPVTSMDVTQAAAVVARMSQGASANTARRRRAGLSQLLRAEVAAARLDRDPMGMLPRTRTTRTMSATAVRPGRVGTVAQARKVIEQVPQRYQPLYLAMLLCGMRPGEAATLDWGRLDLPESGWGTARLAASGAWSPAAFSDDGRTAGRNTSALKHRPDGVVRAVPLHPDLVAALRPHARPEGWVFPGRGGAAAVSEGTVTTTWRKARAKVDSLPAECLAIPYDLRHTYITLALPSVPAQVLAERCGHDVAVLLSEYAHWLPGQGTQWNDALARALG